MIAGILRIKDMLEELLPNDDFEVVPRIEDLQTGIQMTRKHMKGIYIDKARCKLGIERLEGYKKCSIARISDSSTSRTRAMDVQKGRMPCVNMRKPRMRGSLACVVGVEDSATGIEYGTMRAARKGMEAY